MMIIHFIGLLIILNERKLLSRDLGVAIFLQKTPAGQDVNNLRLMSINYVSSCVA